MKSEKELEMNTTMMAMADFAGSLRELRALMRTDHLIGDASPAYEKIESLENNVLDMIDIAEQVWRKGLLPMSGPEADRVAEKITDGVASSGTAIAAARDDLFEHPRPGALRRLGEAADDAHVLFLSIRSRMLSELVSVAGTRKKSEKEIRS